MIRTRMRNRSRNRPLKYPEYDYEYENRPARAGLSTISSLEVPPPGPQPGAELKNNFKGTMALSF